MKGKSPYDDHKALYHLFSLLCLWHYHLLLSPSLSLLQAQFLFLKYPILILEAFDLTTTVIVKYQISSQISPKIPPWWASPLLMSPSQWDLTLTTLYKLHRIPLMLLILLILLYITISIACKGPFSTCYIISLFIIVIYQMYLQHTHTSTQLTINFALLKR